MAPRHDRGAPFSAADTALHTFAPDPNVRQNDVVEVATTRCDGGYVGPVAEFLTALFSRDFLPAFGGTRREDRGTIMGRSNRPGRRPGTSNNSTYAVDRGLYTPAAECLSSAVPALFWRFPGGVRRSGPWRGRPPLS